MVTRKGDRLLYLNSNSILEWRGCVLALYCLLLRRGLRLRSGSALVIPLS